MKKEEKKRKFFNLEKDLKIREKKEEVGEKRTQEDNFWQSLALAGQLGYSVSLPILGGVFLGRFLDSRFFTFPKITLFLLFLGAVFGLGNIYLIVKKVKE